ncbi:MAG: tyrosine-type recombinase/integrase [Candidatus Bathyarchaeia archaeon]|jgi:integrase
MTEKYNLSQFLAQYQMKSTHNLYKSIIRCYLRTLYPELKKSDDEKRYDEFSLQYVSTPRDFRGDLLRFRDQTKDDAPKTTMARFSAILRYLQDNEITFSRNFTRNLLGKADEAISEEHVPTSAELARIIEFMPIGAKTLTLVLASSGMRVGEALQLRLGDMELDRKPPRLNLRYQTTKTKRKRFVLFSDEAKSLLGEWLGFRLDYLRQASARCGMPFDPEDDRIFPFGSDTYLFLWREALERAKLLKIDSATRRMTIRPHNLRKYFRTRGEWTNPDIPEALMGHTSGLMAIYARFDQAEELLEKGYLEAEPHLSIFAGSKTIIDLREKAEKQNNEIDIRIRAYELRNAKLEVEMNQLHDTFIAKTQQEQAEWINAVKSLMTEVSELRAQIQHTDELPAAEGTPVLVPKNFNQSDYEARQKRLGELLVDQAVRA